MPVLREALPRVESALLKTAATLKEELLTLRLQMLTPNVLAPVAGKSNVSATPTTTPVGNAKVSATLQELMKKLDGMEELCLSLVKVLFPLYGSKAEWAAQHGLEDMSHCYPQSSAYKVALALADDLASGRREAGQPSSAQRFLDAVDLVVGVAKTGLAVGGYGEARKLVKRFGKASAALRELRASHDAGYEDEDDDENGEVGDVPLETIVRRQRGVARKAAPLKFWVQPWSDDESDASDEMDKDCDTIEGVAKPNGWNPQIHGSAGLNRPPAFSPSPVSKSAVNFEHKRLADMWQKVHKSVPKRLKRNTSEGGLGLSTEAPPAVAASAENMMHGDSLEVSVRTREFETHFRALEYKLGIIGLEDLKSRVSRAAAPAVAARTAGGPGATKEDSILVSNKLLVAASAAGSPNAPTKTATQGQAVRKSNNSNATALEAAAAAKRDGRKDSSTKDLIAAHNKLPEATSVAGPPYAPLGTARQSSFNGDGARLRDKGKEAASSHRGSPTARSISGRAPSGASSHASSSAAKSSSVQLSATSGHNGVSATVPPLQSEYDAVVAVAQNLLTVFGPRAAGSGVQGQTGLKLGGSTPSVKAAVHATTASQDCGPGAPNDDRMAVDSTPLDTAVLGDPLSASSGKASQRSSKEDEANPVLGSGESSTARPIISEGEAIVAAAQRLAAKFRGNSAGITATGSMKADPANRKPGQKTPQGSAQLKAAAPTITSRLAAREVPASSCDTPTRGAPPSTLSPRVGALNSEGSATPKSSLKQLSVEVPPAPCATRDISALSPTTPSSPFSSISEPADADIIKAYSPTAAVSKLPVPLASTRTPTPRADSPSSAPQRVAAQEGEDPQSVLPRGGGSSAQQAPNLALQSVDTNSAASPPICQPSVSAAPVDEVIRQTTSALLKARPDDRVGAHLAEAFKLGKAHVHGPPSPSVANFKSPALSQHGPGTAVQPLPNPQQPAVANDEAGAAQNVSPVGGASGHIAVDAARPQSSASAAPAGCVPLPTSPAAHSAPADARAGGLTGESRGTLDRLTEAGVRSIAAGVLPEAVVVRASLVPAGLKSRPAPSTSKNGSAAQLPAVAKTKAPKSAVAAASGGVTRGTPDNQ
ncbi:hypothetical protein HK405_003930, partial [Cladochytrium tenue]